MYIGVFYCDFFVSLLDKLQSIAFMKKVIVFIAFLFVASLSVMGQISQEEQTLLDNLERARSRTGETELDYYKGVSNELLPLFQYYWSTGNYVKCEKTCIEVLSVLEKLVGRYDESYAEFQAYLGQVYVYMSKYEEAKETLLSMLDTYAKVEVLENPKNYVSNYAIVGSFFLRMGAYQQAEKYAMESLQLFEKYDGIDPMYQCTALGTLGTVYTSIGQYRKAEEYMFKSLSLIPPGHIEAAKVLNNIGLLYYRMGDYNKSKDYFEQAYEMKKKIWPEGRSLLASSLANVALLSTYAGDYEDAEKKFLEALAMQEENKENNPREYANSLINLGFLYNTMGDYKQAIEYQKRGVELAKQLLGAEHLDYAASLFTQSISELSVGDYESAIQNSLKASEIQQKNSEMHPELVTTLMVLGKAYLMNGDYINAEVTLKNALEKAKALLGEHHDNYAEIMYILGVLYDKKNDIQLAEYYYLQSLGAYKNLYSVQHAKYVIVLNSLGELYHKNGQYSQAKKCFNQAAKSTKDLFVATTKYMSERQRELFWETIRNRYESIYPKFVYDSFDSDSTVAGFAYNNELFMKGLLLHSSTSIHNSIANSGDELLMEKWDKLKQMNMQILGLQEYDPTSTYLVELKKEAEALEKDLTISSTIFRDDKSAWNITWESVRDCLQPNQVAIEFFIAPNVNQENIYCALLLRANSTQPSLIPLCKESRLTSILGSTPSQIYNYSRKGKQLYDLIWTPILAHIQQENVIYFSSTGVLHQLAIEYLPLDRRNTIQDRYKLKRLSSTRELLNTHKSDVISNAVLYGGIQYDMDGEELLAESEVYSHIQLASRDIDGDAVLGGVQYLPGTRKEVDYINKLLKDNEIRTQLYVGGSGNEESFKFLDGKDNQILHIATHGFFWSSNSADAGDYYMRRTLNSAQKDLPVDPLSRCGLLLAGANLSLTGHVDELPQGVQDGILTAKEISLLDLSSTQIAVLSACETGRGEITAEGVFGLQRGLKQAGVNTIIMSLWPVDDVATQLLMQYFYTNWIDNKQDKYEAFRNAQISLKQRYSDPKYWAGFILLD